MTLRVLAAVGALAVAMALQTPSSGLAGHQEKSAAAPARSPKPAPAQSQSVAQAGALPARASTGPVDDKIAAPIVAPTITPATLSMVPSNPRLVARLQTMLPKGITVQQAAVGFRSQTRFVAAVYVAKSLDVPFLVLKHKILQDQLSLGQAIQSLRPDADVALELARAREFTERTW